MLLMRDADFRFMRSVGWATALVASVLGCEKPKPAPPAGAAAASAPSATADAGCPATGKWAECSVLYRLERAGLAPHVDSTAKPEEKSLSGRPMVVKIGLTAKLEVFLYADSIARIADEKKLDRTQVVAPGAEQTIQRERTLIENANLTGLLTSVNNHQRERVADALMAGPPQPPSEPAAQSLPGTRVTPRGARR